MQLTTKPVNKCEEFRAVQKIFNKYRVRPSTLLHNELYWLNVPEKVTFKLGLMTYRCLHGQTPRYLVDHLTPGSEVAPRLRLRSANPQQLIVPRCQLNNYGRRTFSIAGPTVWNSLPDELRDPQCGYQQFLKTILFQFILV